MDDLKRVRDSKTCEEAQKCCFDKQDEEYQIKKKCELVDKKYHNNITISVQHTYRLGRNFPKHSNMCVGRADLPKEIVDGLDEYGTKQTGKPMKSILLWSVVDGDSKVYKEDYRYCSYDDGTILPIGKKSVDYTLKP